MLKKRSDGVFTVNWYPLAPVNEQIHSADDPWLLWVRRQAKEKNRKPFRTWTWQWRPSSVHPLLPIGLRVCPLCARSMPQGSASEYRNAIETFDSRYESVEDLGTTEIYL